MIEALSASTMTGLRDRLIIAVMYRHGLRVSETCDLDRADLDLHRESIRVRNGKYNSNRLLGLDPTVKLWMRTYLEVWGIQYGPLFRTHRGRRIHRSWVHKKIKKLAEDIGINKRVYPHALRHAFASELCSEGVPINMIQKIMGHKSLETTSEYLDHINPRQVIETFLTRDSWMRKG